MLVVDELDEIVLHFATRLFLVFFVFLASLDEMEIGLIALKEEFVPKVDTVLVPTDFVKPVHV